MNKSRDQSTVQGLQLIKMDWVFLINVELQLFLQGRKKTCELIPIHLFNDGKHFTSYM